MHFNHHLFYSSDVLGVCIVENIKLTSLTIHFHKINLFQIILNDYLRKRSAFYYNFIGMAFFKTTTKHLTVRIIQGEILDYKGYLLPFTDIPQKHPHWRAIQQVSATGLLKGIQKTNGKSVEVHFEPNNAVSTEEIKPVLTEIYTRAFLWFNKEKPGAQFTVGNMLSLISDFTLTDPKTLQIYLQKAWTPTYKLTGTFDLSRPITRLEFAVLANKYLNPFAKTVDLSGRMVN